MKHNKTKTRNEFDIDRMKYYMSLTAENKLKYLQEVNEFFSKFRNEKTEKIRKHLKNKGF